MSKPINPDDRPTPEALEQMKSKGGEWFAYQNHDLGSRYVGHLLFLKGTFTTPPKNGPGGWPYVLVGKVNLETGTIEPLTDRRGEQR
jgi:hypothetical protein